MPRVFPWRKSHFIAIAVYCVSIDFFFVSIINVRSRNSGAMCFYLSLLWFNIVAEGEFIEKIEQFWSKLCGNVKASLSRFLALKKVKD